jgi:BirA family biotin operon repressor/biotin-[acetyl-CoA-carboxylase] ligase
MSLLLVPDLPPGRWGGLAIGAAVALALVLERDYGIRPEIKWPNDVLVDGRKLAGILIEGVGDGKFVLGIGINLQWVEGLSQPAFRREPVSLAQACGRVVDAAVVRGALLAALAAVCAALETGHWGLILAMARRRLYGIGRRLRILAADRVGEPALLLGLAEGGGLLVRDDAGNEYEVISGEVEYADRD